MPHPIRSRTAWIASLGCLLLSAPSANADRRVELERDFQEVVQPFVKTYCTGCHGTDKPRAGFDLSPYSNLASVVADLGHWNLVLERLDNEDMPPEDAPAVPEGAERQQVIDWIKRLRRDEAERTAGDPGPVLARRLSNAEYNYTIVDLTGVDIQPTRDFPVDPANEAGFDNSGESLTMSPALLNKYLAAARSVADHLVFLPDGLAFAPHPVVIYSDRDKYCVHRIVEFYQQQPTDYADYFDAAWHYQHRAELGIPDVTLDQIAETEGVSPKYLRMVWAILTDPADDAGPIAELRERWRNLPPPKGSAVRQGCERLRDWVISHRRGFIPPIGNFEVRGMNLSAQPLILWKDRVIADNRRRGKLPESDGSEETEELRNAIARFCSVFPDTFFISERGRMYEQEGLDRALDPSKRSTGRLLSAGFHLMFGYFRDDAPLYELILNQEQQQQLDRMWVELEFVTQAPIRQYSDFIYFERAEGPAYLKAAEFDFAREDTGVTSPDQIERLATLYLAKVREVGIAEEVLEVVDAFFQDTSANIQALKQAIADAEPSHLRALVTLAERAWQRPLTDLERRELIDFYRVSREEVGLSHEDAVRDTLVFILMSPRFCYRTHVAEAGDEPRALSGYELASRLSYFLWSSLPDEELLQLAGTGALHHPEVLLQQTRRMLHDPRAHRFATEFGGNWLDFRRFQSHQGVNRERFPTFTDELRQAMYEEPIHFITDLLQRDGSVLELLNADHTFVNEVLADHYGIPFPTDDPHEWIRIDGADQFGRGGLLPMSVFLTANSPGLRTSPVKRGYWVVRRLLGEHIPPPPPEVPELPPDEAALRDLSVRDALAKHREIQNCAQCHQRFDSIGLVFEGYGPIGEWRERDLGGRPIDDSAIFPDGSQGNGIEGLGRYLRESRQDEFVDNLCRKLLSYGLGRSLLLSDELTIEAMRNRLAAEEYRFSALVETIVTSPQFLRTRGRDYDPRRSVNDEGAFDE